MFLNGYLLMPIQFLLSLVSTFKFYLTSPNVKTFCLPPNPVISSSNCSNFNYRQNYIDPNTFASNYANIVWVTFGAGGGGEQRKSEEWISKESNFLSSIQFSQWLKAICPSLYEINDCPVPST